VEGLVARGGHAAPEVRIAKVDLAKARGVAKLERVDYVPTLKLRSGGRSYVYTGDNDYEQLIAFARHGWKERELKVWTCCYYVHLTLCRLVLSPQSRVCIPTCRPSPRTIRMQPRRPRLPDSGWRGCWRQ
jgi:hypothetical protein